MHMEIIISIVTGNGNHRRSISTNAEINTLIPNFTNHRQQYKTVWDICSDNGDMIVVQESIRIVVVDH